MRPWTALQITRGETTHEPLHSAGGESEPSSSSASLTAADALEAQVASPQAGEQRDLHAISDETCTALLLAVESGDAAILTLLLKHGADPNASNREEMTALHLALEEGEMEMATQLVKAGADIHRGNLEIGRSNTPLHAASGNGEVHPWAQQSSFGISQLLSGL